MKRKIWGTTAWSALLWSLGKEWSNSFCKLSPNILRRGKWLVIVKHRFLKAHYAWAMWWPFMVRWLDWWTRQGDIVYLDFGKTFVFVSNNIQIDELINAVWLSEVIWKAEMVVTSGIKLGSSYWQSTLGVNTGFWIPGWISIDLPFRHVSYILWYVYHDFFSPVRMLTVVIWA